MQQLEFKTWSRLQKWLAEYKAGQKRYAFRGQSDSSWPLRTSLARHFGKNPIGDTEWRDRELKMYQMFRQRLLHTWPGMYDGWKPWDILSLMQHHGAFTRMLDFTFSPNVAAHFALKDARGESAIWVVDCERLEERRRRLDLPPYCGPTHIPKYTKLLHKKYQGGAIWEPEHLHGRLAAQRGCFLNTGSISQPVLEELIDTKVKLSEGVAIESCTRLKELGVDRRSLFPKLGRLAQEVNRFSVTGNTHFPDTGDEADQRG
jgi:hypothetical protein